MKKALKVVVVVIFLALFAGTLVFLWNKTRPKVVTYDIETIKIDTLQKVAVATGKVEPRDEVLIKPQISGIISEIYCEAGKMVRAGEVIAKVKVIPEMVQLNSAASRLNLAKINLEQTKRESNRVKELHKSGVVTDEESEKSITELLRAEEELINAQDNLEIVQNGISSRSAEMSNTQIRATVTGMILDVPIKVGNSVIQSNTFNDGTTIAAIADLNDMIFNGKVDETEVGKLKEGMPVTLTIGALQDVNLNATLEYISPKATDENGIVLFEIKAAAQVPDSIFVRAGYSSNATVVTDRREGVKVIPESVVEFENEKSYVYVLTSPYVDPVVASDSTSVAKAKDNKDKMEEEQTFDRREVKLGLSDGIKVELISGLDGTEKLRGAKQSNKK